MAVTSDKETAFRAVINTWLKDKTKYCIQCGAMPYEMTDGKCCNDQLMGTNWDYTKAIIEQNKDITQTRANDYGSTEKKDLRWGLSLPTSLYSVLNQFKKMNNLPPLFNEKGEIEWFMKKFPSFKTCART